MVVVNCVMWHDKIKEVAASLGEYNFEVAEETTHEVSFNHSGTADAAAGALKSTLKGKPEFRALFFQVHAK